MNLLEASETLIDTAKQFPENRKLTQAIKRMEKRVKILRIRARKAFRRRRWSAWHDARAILGNNVQVGPSQFQVTSDPICRHCKHEISFKQFCAGAIVCGRGHVKYLGCPKCGAHLLGYESDIPDDLCS